MADEVTVIFPDWNEDDFYGEKPYQWIFEHTKNDPFLRQTSLARADAMAKKIGVKSFMANWKSYMNRITPKPENGVTTFPEQPIMLKCGEYTCDAYGVATQDRIGRDVIVLNHPLMPVRRITDIDTGEQKIELAYTRDGEHWQTMVVDCTTVAAAQKITSLSKYGLGINSENAKLVVKYLGDIIDANYSALPVQKSTAHMGWLPDGRFAPYCDDVVCTPESPDMILTLEDVKPVGDESAWMDMAHTIRTGQSVAARIALAMTFAAPLLGKLGALPFFVHLWGVSGCGKTVSMMTAASAWGNPDSGRFMKTMNSTRTALELHAALCGNVPVFLDELQAIKDRKDFDDLIYMLCEGMSKGRGARDGGLQRQRKWNTIFMTTGEQPLSRESSGGGAVARVVDIHCAEDQMFRNPDQIAEIAKANYGWAGRRFIEAMQQPGMIQKARELQRMFAAALGSGSDLHEKQVLSASILLTADALADQVLFHDGLALTADEIRPCLVTRDMVDPNVRCYGWLRGFIAGNPLRFRNWDRGNNGEVWGQIEDDGTILIIKSFFDKMLEDKGFSSTSFLNWAKRNKKIKIDTTRGNRFTFRRRINGSEQVQCVILMPEPDEPEPEIPQPIPVEVGDDMPF